MLGFLKSRAYTIGVDLGDDTLKLVQLTENGKGVNLIAGRSECRPKDIEPGSSSWQKWVIDAIHRLMSNDDFRGKDATAAMPSNNLYIDHMKMPKKSEGEVQEALFSRIRQKLPFQATIENTVVEYFPTENDNVLVMAAERAIIDRLLAIYEKTGLHLKTISVWPMALTTCYAKFFGRRQSDLDAVVMLLCIEPTVANVVICRHKNPLFAHSISIGAEQFGDEQAVTRLVLELTGCRRQFSSIYRDVQIERLIFLAGRGIDKEICTAIARQLEIPAQVGDCLAAVKIAESYRLGIDRRTPAASQAGEVQRQQQVNWATAFGLCLS